MSDTPRTDNAAHGFIEAYGKDAWDIECVDADFARQLERENARLREALERLLLGIDDFWGTEYAPGRAAVEQARAALRGDKE